MSNNVEDVKINSMILTRADEIKDKKKTAINSVLITDV